MIQRKQTIYLFVAMLLLIVSMFMPIAIFVHTDMTPDAVWTNCVLKQGDIIGINVLPALLVSMATLVSIITIFMYKRRQTQMKLCLLGMLFGVAWEAVFATMTFTTYRHMGAIHVKSAPVLVLISILLFYLARRGVQTDEKLVRSMDRIR